MLGVWQKKTTFAVMIERVKPKKSLGQHFLTDMTVAARIADTIDGYAERYPVVEIGPGTGVLTQFLLQKAQDLTVVEIDRESVEYLDGHFPELQTPGRRIISRDFLREDLDRLMEGRDFVVIGNYPYNISSQIFFKILDYKDRVPCIAGMLQREVALRLAAPAGTKDRGILSVLLQLWYDVEYLFTVEPGVFNPPPKVRSGVIRLRRNGVIDPGCDLELLRRIVKATFGMRRKTLRNSLRSLPLRPDAVIDSPLLSLRPEQLSVAQFVELTNIVQPLLVASAPAASKYVEEV